ncbi:MAG TPA: molybdenum cofactor biosynthesis protein B [Pirellulales bacterium]|nr:molybdenum cofactor biosynthesis protein B [Pirellulales bacterium]
MSRSVDEHRAEAPPVVRCAVITISDTRTLETDRGGQTIVDRLTAAGHTIADRQITSDDPAQIGRILTALNERTDIDAILLTGGTGIGSRDQTFETVGSLLSKPLPGYGELFRMLSYEQVGAAAMLSRAIGALMGRKVLLTMPGSVAAVELAMDKLILPELGHLVREARR